jgi:hypothetical protein
MRVQGLTGLFLLTSFTCFAQSSKKEKCPEGAAPAACKSFAELRKAHDPKLESSLKNDAYVCFEPKRDEFYAVYFDFPTALQSMENANPKLQPKPFDGAGYLELRDYRSGVFAPEGRSKVIVGFWSKQDAGYEFDSTGIPANDDPPSSWASVNAESVTVKQDFKNTAGEQTHFALVVQRSTSRFELNYHYVLENGRQDTETVEGRCLSFKRQ